MKPQKKIYYSYIELSKKRCITFYKLPVVFFCILVSQLLHAQPTEIDFQNSFASPPATARPHTLWHWTSGNISHDGITQDLEWMKRVGIAGFQLANVNFGSGQQVEKKIMFGSLEWLPCD